MSLGKKIVPKTILGEEVFLRPMNGGAFAVRAMELSVKITAEPWLIAELGALMVCCSLCDKDGRLLHTDPNLVREEASLEFLTEFANVAAEVSGLGNAPEASSGNLPAVPSASSSST